MTSPDTAAPSRRARLAPKPITGFGHSVGDEEVAGSPPPGRQPEPPPAAAPEPRRETAPAAQPAATRPPAAPTREPAPRTSPRRSRAAAPALPRTEPGPETDVRALVRAARTSARDRPREWQAFTARLPADLARRLNLRVAQDKRATGDYGLAAAHYLNAALSQVPEDLDQAAQWGLDWRARTADIRVNTTGAGSRLHEDVASAMHELGSWLRTLDIHPKMWEVMAEALTRFLDALDALDTPTRPRPPG
jgi:hypothetical protein